LREGKKKASGFRPQASGKAILLKPFDVFSTLKEGVAGGGERLPSGKHRLPLPQEGVCLKTRAFRGFRPGGTAIAVPPPKKADYLNITIFISRHP
jgi:hypothetical protein